MKKRGLDGKLKPPQDLANVRGVAVPNPINPHINFIPDGLRF